MKHGGTHGGTLGPVDEHKDIAVSDRELDFDRYTAVLGLDVLLFDAIGAAAVPGRAGTLIASGVGVSRRLASIGAAVSEIGELAKAVRENPKRYVKVEIF